MNVDFHAHILPAADHGCGNVETALEQLRLAKAAGVDLVVATPHFYPQMESYERFLERRGECWQTLTQAMKGLELPKVLLGAEAHVCVGMDHLEGLRQMCIGDSRAILLEMPATHWPQEIFKTVERIREECDLIPVLAHIDRYSARPVDALLESGALAQLNADGMLSRLRRGRYRALCQAERIVGVGSDIHGTATGYRYYERARAAYGDEWDEIMERSCGLLFGAPVLQRENSFE